MKILLNEEGQEGGGVEDVEQQNQQQVEQENQENQQQGGDQQQETPQALTKDDISAILKEVLPAATQPSSQHREPSLTQEEYDRIFNVWQPNTELLEQLRSEDKPTALKALAALRDGLIKQASTIAEARLQNLVKEMREKELAPLSAFYQEQQNIALEREFFAEHKDLEPFKEVVDAVSAKVFSDGKKYSKTEAFNMAASASREVVKRMLAASGGKLPNGSSSGGTGRRMSTLTSGGQGGGSKGGGQPARKPGMAIFDDTND